MFIPNPEDAAMLGGVTPVAPGLTQKQRKILLIFEDSSLKNQHANFITYLRVILI